MNPPLRQLLHESFKLIDLLIMSAALVLALWASSGISLSAFVADRATPENVPLLIVLWIAWHLVFYRLGLYGSRRLVPRRREARDIFWAATLGTLLITSAASILKVRLENPQFVLVFWTTSTFLTLAGRMALRSALEWARKRGRNLRNVVVVGTSPESVRFARAITASRTMGYHVLGFVDRDRLQEENLDDTGYRIVATSETLHRFLAENPVDEVLVARSFGSSDRDTARMVSICEAQGITVRFVAHLFGPKLARAKIESFQGVPVLTFEASAMGGGQELVKRFFDVVVSAALLIVLSPVFAATALAVRWSSSGGVFFAQERVGFRKRTFRLFKFRTMVPDAEDRLADIEHLNEVDGPVFKIKDDPRVTKIGKFLRRTSIDELPQLWNVLRGDMSLVGPRPLPLRDYEGFSEDQHRRRFTVRPGLTCLWQVSGRNSIPFDRWMELDLEYIDQWSLARDLEILLRTVPVVLRGFNFTRDAGEFSGVIDRPAELDEVLREAKITASGSAS